MKARIPKHREFIITFPEGTDEARNQQARDKLNELLEAAGQGPPGRVRLQLYHRGALSSPKNRPRIFCAAFFFAPRCGCFLRAAL